MSHAACPPPSYDVEPDDNRPIRLDESLVEPSLGVVNVARTCPVQDVTFSIEPALEDPDGDVLRVFWYVDFEGTNDRPDSERSFDYTFDPCTHPKGTPGASLHVEAVVMDRPPPNDVIAPREPTGDGDVVELHWFVEIAQEDACCPAG